MKLLEKIKKNIGGVIIYLFLTNVRYKYFWGFSATFGIKDYFSDLFQRFSYFIRLYYSNSLLNLD